MPNAPTNTARAIHSGVSDFILLASSFDQFFLAEIRVLGRMGPWKLT